MDLDRSANSDRAVFLRLQRSSPVSEDKLNKASAVAAVAGDSDAQIRLLRDAGAQFNRTILA